MISPFGKRLKPLFLPLAALSVCFALFLIGAAAPTGETSAPAETAGRPFKEPFPSFYFTSYYNEWLARESEKPCWVSTEIENGTLIRQLRDSRPIYLNNDIIAYYGHPLSPNMGILGRYTKEELNTQLNSLASEYNAANGKRGVRKAFYIIYGTVQPGGGIGNIPEPDLQEYIRFGLEHDILIFIDHQIGKYDPIDSLREILPYLQYPNVHLALDPEWRTDKPMRNIGSVTAEEINRAQEIMSRYMTDHRIPGERMLVIHQFDYRMLKDRDEIHTGYNHVTLVHCSDGFGGPALKRNTYAYNARATNIPVKGFKLFYNFEIPGAGYDDPLLSPEEVLELNPRPSLIMYQ
jgi:hypothetical protein